MPPDPAPDRLELVSLLRVADFAARYDRMRAAGVVFEGEPRLEPYGRVVVFRDLAGNRWDLLGPA